MDRMSLDSYNNLDTLVAKCFNANAIIDNLAYNLDYHYLNRIAKIVHLNVAHVMPEWADVVSDFMLQQSVRPTRKDISGYQQEYKDLKEIFRILKQIFMEMRDFIKVIIETADMEGDDEVRIFAEEFLMRIQPYIKQSEEWINISEILDAQTINIHIEDYTHFIKA